MRKVKCGGIFTAVLPYEHCEDSSASCLPAGRQAGAPVSSHTFDTTSPLKYHDFNTTSLLKYHDFDMTYLIFPGFFSINGYEKRYLQRANRVEK